MISISMSQLRLCPDLVLPGGMGQGQPAMIIAVSLGS